MTTWSTSRLLRSSAKVVLSYERAVERKISANVTNFNVSAWTWHWNNFRSYSRSSSQLQIKPIPSQDSSRWELPTICCLVRFCTPLVWWMPIWDWNTGLWNFVKFLEILFGDLPSSHAIYLLQIPMRTKRRCLRASRWFRTWKKFCALNLVILKCSHSLR